DGDLTQDIHLRTGDELRELEAAFNKMILSLRNIVKKDREIISGLIALGDRIQTEIDKKNINREELINISKEIHTITTELSKITSEFKIDDEEHEGKEDS
ncbi:HAMP domain-containing protein, partial [Candidatus Riflebacteria bacterium]